MGSIYLALNTITRKYYIGQTQRSTRERKRVHISEAMRGSSTYFHRALRKYGVTFFKWSTLLRDVPNAKLDY